MKWLADENFNNAVIRGILRRRADIDLVRVQDVGLGGCPDEEVLEWAARQGRSLLTHDVTTITGIAYGRVSAGGGLQGVFEVLRGAAIGAVIEDVLLIDECSHEGEWDGQIVYLRLKRLG